MDSQHPWRGILLDTLYSFPCLTIAVIEGPAVGSGADLALACDLRLGTAAASFSFPGSGFGLVLGTARLAALAGPRSLGAAAAQGRIDADEAHMLGLLTDLVEPDGLETRLQARTRAFRRAEAGARPALLQASRPSVSDRVLADLVRSVSRPGLDARVKDYLQRSAHRRDNQQRGPLPMVS